MAIGFRVDTAYLQFHVGRLEKSIHLNSGAIVGPILFGNPHINYCSPTLWNCLSW